VFDARRKPDRPYRAAELYALEPTKSWATAPVARARRCSRSGARNAVASSGVFSRGKPLPSQGQQDVTNRNNRGQTHVNRHVSFCPSQLRLGAVDLRTLPRRTGRANIPEINFASCRRRTPRASRSVYPPFVSLSRERARIKINLPRRHRLRAVIEGQRARHSQIGY